MENEDNKEFVMSQEDAEYLTTLLFENSMAYTKAVASEDRIKRLERIEKALLNVQYKSGMAYQKILHTPRGLK